MRFRQAGITLPDEFFFQVDMIAWAENRSRSDVIREATSDLLHRKRKDPDLVARLEVLLKDRPETLARFLKPLAYQTTPRGSIPPPP